MKRIAFALMVAGLLVAGCDSQSEEAAPGSEGAVPPAAEGALPATAGGDTAAQAQQKAVNALGVILPDAKSARYSEVRAGTAGAVCGMVDAKQPDGKYSGPRPFVVSPEGVAVVSTSPQVMFDDPEDVFPDFYIRWCATPAELRLIGPRVALPGAPAPTNVEDIPDLLEQEIAAAPPPLPPAEPPPPPPTAQAKATTPAAPSGDDSFSSAVVRERKDGAPGK